MLYARALHGDCWHMVLKHPEPESYELGCGVALLYVDEITMHPPRDKVCHNCDKSLRDRGRKKKPPTKPRKDVYNPRFKFEDQ